MQRVTRFARRSAVLLLVALLAGCASSSRNPFSGEQGVVTIRIINRTDDGLNVTVLDRDQRIHLGQLVAGESRDTQIRWEGEKDLRLRLARVVGGETADTFPVLARPGDAFLLELNQGRSLQSARLVRAF